MRLGDIAVPRDPINAAGAGVTPPTLIEECDRQCWNALLTGADLPPSPCPTANEDKKLPPFTQAQLRWVAHELSHDFLNVENAYDRVRWNNRAMGMAFNTIAAMRTAVQTFLEHQGQELCHDRRGELAKAFELTHLAILNKAGEDVETFGHGCNAYQRELFGTAYVDKLAAALLAVLQPEKDGQPKTAGELYDDRRVLVGYIGPELAAKLTQVVQENVRRQRHIEDLQAGTYVNCVYCGHRYGPSANTPVSLAQMLRDHVAACPAHPMSQLLVMLRRVQESGYLKAGPGSPKADLSKLLEQYPNVVPEDVSKYVEEATVVRYLQQSIKIFDALVEGADHEQAKALATQIGGMYQAMKPEYRTLVDRLHPGRAHPGEPTGVERRVGQLREPQTEEDRKVAVEIECLWREAEAAGRSLNLENYLRMECEWADLEAAGAPPEARANAVKLQEAKAKLTPEQLALLKYVRIATPTDSPTSANASASVTSDSPPAS